MNAQLMGILPESLLHTEWFAVLATLVALNTLAYAALALVKLLPALHPGEWFQGRERRGEDRSIYPDTVVATPGATASPAASRVT